MKFSVPETPVLTKVFQVSGASVKVRYSIDVVNDNPFNKDSEVCVYSVNNVPPTLFTRVVREEIDMLIREHATNVLNELEETKAEAAGDESRGN